MHHERMQDSLTDREIDQSLDGLETHIHGDTLLGSLPDDFAEPHPHTNSDRLLRQIEDLETRLREANLPMEARGRQALEDEIFGLKRLLIDTPLGPEVIDHHAPRVVNWRQCFGGANWHGGFGCCLPCSGVFSEAVSVCTVEIEAARFFGWVHKITWSQPLLGKHFPLRLMTSPADLLFGAILYLIFGLVLGAPIGYFAYGVLGSLWGILSGAVCATVILTVLSRQSRSLSLEAHFSGVIPRGIRNLLPRLRAEFDEVLFVRPVEWIEKDHPRVKFTPRTSILSVLVRRNDVYWVAAYAVISPTKEVSEHLCLDILLHAPEEEATTDPESNAGTLSTDVPVSPTSASSRKRALDKVPSLDLSRTDVCDQQVAQRLSSIDPSSVYDVDLSETRIIDLTVGRLCELPNLRSVNLSRTAITDQALVELAEMPNLQSIVLNETQITEEGLKHLRRLTKLEGLGLAWTKVTDTGFTVLKEMVSLLRLDLSNTAITESGLAELRDLLNLQVLNLSRTEITNTGFALHIQGLTDLTELVLTDTKIMDGGAVKLCNLTKLEAIDLSGTKITDAGLVGLYGLTALRRLSLANTEITDAGIVSLGGLTELVELNLSGTKISDYALKALATKLTKLRILRLERTDIKYESVHEFLRDAVVLETLVIAHSKVDLEEIARLCEARLPAGGLYFATLRELDVSGLQPNAYYRVDAIVCIARIRQARPHLHLIYN